MPSGGSFQKGFLLTKRKTPKPATNGRPSRRDRNDDSKVLRKQTTSSELLEFNGNHPAVFEIETAAPTLESTEKVTTQGSSNESSAEHQLLSVFKTRQISTALGDNLARADVAGSETKEILGNENSSSVLKGNEDLGTNSKRSWLLSERANSAVMETESSPLQFSRFFDNTRPAEATPGNGSFAKTTRKQDLISKLSSTLLRVRRTKEWKLIGSNFVGHYLLENEDWEIAWDLLLSGDINERKARLGHCLLEVREDLFLSNFATEVDHVRLKNALSVLEFHLDNARVVKGSFVDTLIPRFNQITTAQSRTVWAQQAMDITTKIAAMAANNPYSRDDEEITGKLYMQLDAITALLQTQLKWQKSLLDKSSLFTRDGARIWCKCSLLTDWIMLNQRFRQSGTKQEWCLELSGHSCNTNDNDEKFMFGGFASTLVGPSTTRMEDLLGLMLSRNMDRDANNNRPFLRALAAWFCRKEKMLSLLGDNTQLLEQQLVYVVRHTKARGLSYLWLPVLNVIWSGNGFCPYALNKAENLAAVPEVFDSLILAASESNEGWYTGYARKFVVEVLVRSVYRSGSSLWILLLGSYPSSKSLFDTAFAILSSFDGRSTQLTLKEQTKTRTMAFNFLLTKSHLDSSMATRLLSEGRLAELVYATDSSADLASSIAEWLVSKTSSYSGILCEVVVESLMDARLEQHRLVCFVSFIVSVLKIVNTHMRDEAEKICCQVGELYRDSLLVSDDAQWDPQRYGQILVIAGRQLLTEPSCDVALALFGGIAGHDQPVPNTSPKFEASAREAALAVVELVCTSLYGSEMAESNIFARLAPLLLLRRLPAQYYSFLWLISGSEIRIRELLARLAKQLHVRTGSLSHQIEYQMTERRLAAEIAGRALPFSLPRQWPGDADTCTAYHALCRSPFRLLKETISMNDNQVLPEQQLCCCFAVLIVCTRLGNTCSLFEPLNDIVDVASFALERLCCRKDGDEKHSDLTDKLQMGCMDFFARTAETFFYLSSFESAEFDPFSPSRCSINKHSTSIQQTGCVLVLILEVLTDTSDKKRDIHTRLCLWNSLTISVQRCTQRGFYNLLETLLPRVLDWIISVVIREDPLCLDASLQVAILSLTRASVEDTLCWDRGKGILEKAADCSFVALRRGTSNSKSPDFIPLRKSAIKLAVAVKANSEADESLLEPVKMKKMLHFLRIAAEEDEHEETRRLAASFFKLGVLL